MHINSFLTLQKSTVTKYHSIIVLLVSVLVSGAILFYGWTHRKQSKTRITWTVHQGLHGWGYDILVNDNVFIHQETIPGTTGQTGFPKREQAEQAAALLLDKLRRGESPVITPKEEEQICPLSAIQYERPGKTE